ncbi:Response regulator c-di-GMP phosphodiesterase, RpfG family, contains REC and HD-GYP domains [Orenia metallireducens]|uniref:Stage 0 sporulation protein A homolog n=1 Tax=Orenia metallireducens TaxID=1413210 RepID=A0A285F2A2_9FIRM|nr:DUF3369 domain-containing protein [Orenia metallireducens]SNY05440.1 Response regulator c-di-GMP phosphodiesterase, RpfG family, contains REC and HD-GYP domains [Orenia metallireducens]
MGKEEYIVFNSKEEFKKPKDQTISVQRASQEIAKNDGIFFAPEVEDKVERELFSSKVKTKQDDFRDGWKLLIVDDEEAVHKMTKMVLKSVSFEGKGIEFISAYSGSEAKKIMEENLDIAVILLDVVMEDDDSGLKVAKYVREDLGNNLVRIILRTGQPGQAPEREVIKNYDINDYKEKTELTSQKLYTAIITAFRSYNDLNAIRRSKLGLQKIIESSATLFRPEFLKKSLQEFIASALFQLSALLKMEKSFLYTSGFAAESDGEQFCLLGGIEQYYGYVNKPVKDVVSKKTYQRLNQVRQRKESCFFGNEYIAYFESNKGTENILYLKGEHDFNDFDKNLLEIFSTNIIAAFDHILMNQEIVETQKEIILILSEMTETRSKETAQHVRRVAEYACFLGEKLGLDTDMLDTLKLASYMHDIGKIGISDAILKKPEALTEKEYRIMKRHTEFGYDILKSSKRKILQAAAIIAYQHHERWDGTGYPVGLKGEEIHIFARIVGLIDVFDALSHKRVYKEPWEIKRVLELIKRERGKHFDPKLVDIFFENLDEILAINKKYPDKLK